MHVLIGIMRVLIGIMHVLSALLMISTQTPIESSEKSYCENVL